MEQVKITIDAHALVWYLHDPSRELLSAKALKSIISAEDDGIVYVPSIVLLEVLRLIEKGKFQLVFLDLLSWIAQADNYKIIPLDDELLKVIAGTGELELHDRIIVATARMTDSVLVSKDQAITSKFPNTVW